MTDGRGQSAWRRLAEAIHPSDDAKPAFVEGLFLGAMVGAAIAGSTLWSRWRERAGRTLDSRDVPVASRRRLQASIGAAEERPDN